MPEDYYLRNLLLDYISLHRRLNSMETGQDLNRETVELQENLLCNGL